MQGLDSLGLLLPGLLICAELGVAPAFGQYIDLAEKSIFGLSNFDFFCCPLAFCLGTDF